MIIIDLYYLSQESKTLYFNVSFFLKVLIFPHRYHSYFLFSSSCIHRYREVNHASVGARCQRRPRCERLLYHQRYRNFCPLCHQKVHQSLAFLIVFIAQETQSSIAFQFKSIRHETTFPTLIAIYFLKQFDILIKHKTLNIIVNFN